VDVGVLIDKCREEHIDSQVNEPLALSQEDECVCQRGQSPMCWSSPKIRIRYQTVCLLHRGYRVDGAFLPKCSGPGSSPPALCAPDNSSIGCADGGSATGALELPPLCLRATLRLRTASVMRNEQSGKYTPRPPLCPSCAQIMRLARTTSRFGNLPDLYTFECRACGVWHIDAA
jgi:hypothetical protein